MFVSIIIPTWRRAATLRQTLDSVAEQWPEGANSGCEIIVVSDGDDEATRELARTYSAAPVEWIFHESNLGLASARNTGAAHAHGELLLFLDDDTLAAPGLLNLHIDAHECNAPEAECASKLVVCGRIVESPVAEQGSKTGRLLERSWAQTLNNFEAGLWRDDGDCIPADAMKMSCFGLNCSIRRELFEAVGGFNPALRYMDEEMELGCRLYMLGVRFIIEPGAVVYHRNDKDLVKYYERCWRLGGSDDVLRVTNFGERNEQTRQLLGMDSGPVVSRMVNRAFWHANGLARGVAAILRKVTEQTGSRASFRLWQETSRRQHYWQSVRESGISRDELRQLPGNPVRFVMLHSVAQPQNAAEASYYLSPERFHRFLQVMRRGGYTSADPCKLLEERARWGKRELVLTFDDGYDDFYTEVFPLLESYRLKPLMFVVVDRIGGSNVWDRVLGVRTRQLLDAAQIRELHRHGVRFGSHTLTHPRLTDVSDVQLRRELEDSKHKLEDLLGAEVAMLAYPFGVANRRVRAAAIEAGYKLAVTTVEGLNVWQDPFSLLRTDFNDLVQPRFYAWKLRHGVSPRRSLKEQAMPLLSLIPRRMKQPFQAAVQWRSKAAHG